MLYITLHTFIEENHYSACVPFYILSRPTFSLFAQGSVYVHFHPIICILAAAGARLSKDIE